MELQTTLSLLHSSSATPLPETPDKYGREPFHHAALDGLSGVSVESKDQILSKTRIANLALDYGLDTVIRWKPKRVCSPSLSWLILRLERGLYSTSQVAKLHHSGQPLVLTQALYAIVGAIALQKGGEVANNAVKERILWPLGLQL